MLIHVYVDMCVGINHLFSKWTTKEENKGG